MLNGTKTQLLFNFKICLAATEEPGKINPTPQIYDTSLAAGAEKGHRYPGRFRGPT